VSVEEDLITHLGLLLTQTRFARRALEDIERATSTYATFAFTSVIAAGPRFGAPPLVDGALKVHVVNISDLAPGGGFGSFLEGLLGGVGRFVGNLAGGIVGGTISSVSLIAALPTIHNIAIRIERILQMLGIGSPAKPGEPPPPETGRGAPVGGPPLATQLESIRTAVDSLTGLFLAAGGEPERAAQVSNLPSTPEGERWQRLADSTTVMLNALSRVVDGLIIAIPIALGAVASLISRLGDIRLAIAETLQFALRNALLLRGVVAVVVFDTLAMVARVAAGVVRTLVTTLDGILSAAFDTIREALLAVLQLGAVLGQAVKSTVDELLNWLVPTVDAILRNLADLRAFRVLTHVIRILPAILPPIFELKNDRPLPAPQLKALQRAAKLPFLDALSPGPARKPGAVPPAPLKPPPFPDIGKILTDEDLTNKATGALNRMEQVTADGLRIIKDTGEGGLRSLGTQLDAAAASEARLSDANLAAQLTTVQEQSTALASKLIVGERVTPRTGLETIADAYERWLSGGGLNTLLGTITRHFTSEEGQAGIPRRIVEGSQDRPRATVQIDEVIIEVEGSGFPTLTPEPGQGQPGSGPLGPGDFPLQPDRDDIEKYSRMWFDYNLRGGSSRLPVPT